MFKSFMQEGTLKLLEYFWNNTEDNMFIVALNEENDFYIEEMNPSQIKNFGFDLEKVQHKTLKEVVGEEAAKKFEQKYHQCLEENRPVVVDEEVVVNGVTRYWNTMVIPMHDTINGVKRVFGIAREFTELLETKKHLETFNIKLEESVKVRTSELENVNQKLYNFAYQDALTGIGNRRFFFDKANALFEKAEKKSIILSLIYMDLDFFKLINDTYGHSFGDQVLKEFGTLLETFVRKNDVLCRFGGEEFILLLPNTTNDEATTLAKKIQEKTEEYNFLFGHKKVDVTVSIGVGTYQEKCKNIDGLIHKADKALYKAKNQGRNRIEKAE